MTSKAKDEVPKQRTRSRATTPEARENELIFLAYDLAEKQLRNGTASPSVISGLLRYGSQRERSEQTKLARENELLKARVEQLSSATKSEELYAEVIEAMREYSGNGAPEDDDDY